MAVRVVGDSACKDNAECIVVVVIRVGLIRLHSLTRGVPLEVIDKSIN